MAWKLRLASKLEKRGKRVPARANKNLRNQRKREEEPAGSTSEPQSRSFGTLHTHNMEEEREQATRPLFVGNLAPYVKPRHLTRLFEEKGTVAKIGEYTHAFWNV